MYIQIKSLVMLLILVFALSGFVMADISFTDVTQQAGIDNTSKGACVAIVDFDNDGLPDIYVGNSGRSFEPLGKANILYHNNGDGTFTDIASETGLDDERQTTGAAFGDFDNDGDIDLYVVNDFGINAMYMNNGDGTFEDITESSGTVGGIDVIGGDEIPNGYGTAIADIDNDGLLDIYVVNLGGANILYRNTGNMKFEDITDSAGVKAGVGPQGAGTAAAFGDCDDNGMVDLYAVNGYGLPGFFYLNSAEGFKDRTNKAGIGEQEDGAGTAFGDYDNDGDLDLFVTNFADAVGAPVSNILYENDGHGVFEDVTEDAGISGLSYSLGAVFGDLDNDGYLDLYVVNNGEPNTLYRNNGDRTFTDVSEQAGVTDPGFGSNVALGDLNDDGFLDMYVANSGIPDEDVGDPDILYINNGGQNHWLGVKLESTVSNMSGIGAQVSVNSGDLNMLREISGGRGYAQDNILAHFGLGGNEVVDSITVSWPSGIEQTINNVPADQNFVIVEGESTPVEPGGATIKTWAWVKQSEPEEAIEVSSAGQNYPNPFNPETWIPFKLAVPGSVVISIYNSYGQLVRELDLGSKAPGMYMSKNRAAYWDGRNEAGEEVVSGVYFYQIRTEDFTGTGKMLLIR
ncbi:T9SS type A sorting domain-containing protein [Candidatus Poribacteria bacterium]|nr:T9SS type A sorting domain-containing protein [Candidatus Poribacteria bacterium]